MKREIVTVAGSPGSGKSATAKALAAALGFRHFSSGDRFRELAALRGESIEATNVAAEVQREIDLEVDRQLQEMGRRDEKIVIDSRMAWRWMPHSFKVYLVLDPDRAAERIFEQVRSEGRLSEEARSVGEVRDSIARRFASEKKRYEALYGVDFTDALNFDLVVNTRDNDLSTVTAILAAAFRAWRGAPQPSPSMGEGLGGGVDVGGKREGATSGRVPTASRRASRPTDITPTPARPHQGGGSDT